MGDGLSMAVSKNMKSNTEVHKSKGKNRFAGVLRHWQLYVFLLPAIIYFILFRYIPMFGVQIAFKQYNAVGGIWGSPWAANNGFENFIRFFSSTDCFLIIKNTILISVYNLIIGFPIPIVLALLINQTRNLKFKKVVQTTVLAPYFISIVVIAGMMKIFLAQTGIINIFIEMLGGNSLQFLTDPKYFRTTYIISEVWQTAGYSTIVYIAALAGVSPELHESAVVDGATKWQRIRFIDFPSILPTAIVLLILNSGRVLTIGFEKIYLLQNELNRTTSEVLSTYVYKSAFGAVSGLPDFSYAAAIGLFEAVVSLVIMLSVNQVSKKYSDTSVL